MKKNLEEAISVLKELDDLLTERIVENNIASELQPTLLVKQFGVDLL